MLFLLPNSLKPSYHPARRESQKFSGRGLGFVQRSAATHSHWVRNRFAVTSLDGRSYEWISVVLHVLEQPSRINEIILVKGTRNFASR